MPNEMNEIPAERIEGRGNGSKRPMPILYEWRQRLLSQDTIQATIELLRGRRWLGHPLHPVLTDVTVTLLPASFALDTVAVLRRSYIANQAAYLTMLAGYLSALPTLITGLAEYSSIPPGSRVHRLATMHALLNLTAGGLTTLNLLSRRWHWFKRRPSGYSYSLSTLTFGILMLSAYIGGELVYKHGMGVEK